MTKTENVFRKILVDNIYYQNKLLKKLKKLSNSINHSPLGYAIENIQNRIDHSNDRLRRWDKTHNTENQL